jgi:hypothetical protein
VTLDLIELLANILCRQKSVKDVAGLDALRREERVIVLKGFD